MRYILLVCALLCAAPAFATGAFNPLARVVAAEGDGARVVLGLSQPVPWRVRTEADPYRLILEFREVDWNGLDARALGASDAVAGVEVGRVAGWSHLALTLTGPYAVKTAGMVTDPATGAARVEVTLAEVSEAAFRAGVPPAAEREVVTPVVPAPEIRAGRDGPVVVVIDPGHGGVDPGAERDGVTEAALMLAFARELREELLRDGRFEVVLTRDADEFVSLERRVSVARQAGADVFLSLHADALAEGRASGATVYTLAESAAERASEKLTERHARTELLAGVDLSDQDDVIADVLMDLARKETDPRSDRLAAALVAGITAEAGAMHKRPRLSAGFSVLKAPDIPSVLLELGFISSEADRERLLSAAWRARMARGIRVALLAWVVDDAAAITRYRK